MRRDAAASDHSDDVDALARLIEAEERLRARARTVRAEADDLVVDARAGVRATAERLESELERETRAIAGRVRAEVDALVADVEASARARVAALESAGEARRDELVDFVVNRVLGTDARAREGAR